MTREELLTEILVINFDNQVVKYHLGEVEINIGDSKISLKPKVLFFENRYMKFEIKYEEIEKVYVFKKSKNMGDSAFKIYTKKTNEDYTFYVSEEVKSNIEV